MIGRGAQGNPWIFKKYITSDTESTYKPSNDEVAQTVVEHVKRLHQFYGDYQRCANCP